MKMSKRLSAIVLTVVFAVSLFSTAAIPGGFGIVETQASEIINSGKCGDNLTWTLDNEGLLTITGKGEMWFAFGSPWWNTKKVKKLVIENGVTSIGADVFEECSNLTSITIPKSVSSIGSGAFSGCTGLTSITIPEGVSSIGWHTFSGCTGLTSIVIPNNVKTIGHYAFSDCTGLKSISISEGTTSIEDFAFLNCTGITNIAINPSNPVYDSRNDCNAIIESDSNKLIIGCNYSTIPDSVTSIGPEAFRDCKGITSIIIPESVSSIENRAFGNCSGLTSIIIPKSVTNVGTFVFSACTSLTSITVDPLNTVYDSRNDCNAIIESETNELIAGCSQTVIPENVTRIGNYAFENLSGLTGITIPESVTSIGIGAFEGCSGLTSISIPKSVTSIENFAFYGCGGLKNIEVDALNKVYDSRNDCNAIIESSSNTLVVGSNQTIIPEDVTNIGFGAFRDCRGLTSIMIPKNIANIGLMAFYNCSELNSITVDPLNTVYDSRNNCNAIISSAGNALLFGCNNTIIPKDVRSIDSNAFYGCSGLTDIVIPESVTSIGPWAFYNCSGLTSISIPKGVESIGDYSFYGCIRLTDISIQEGVTTIGNYAFMECQSLKEVSIPRSMKNIAYGAFKDCRTLSDVYYGGTEIDYSKLTISVGNDCLTDAFWHYQPHVSHVWDKGIVTKKPTALSSGTKKYTCTICGNTKTETIKKLKPTIRISAKKKSIKKKKSFNLTISKLASGDSIKTLKPSKKNIVKIKKIKKNKYRITGKKKGKTVITVILKSGKKANCTVTVK